MESKNTNPILTALAGLLSGAAVGLVCLRRDMQAGKPTLVDKVKKFESRLYAEGQVKAATLEQIKREARQIASLD